jgi:hypothetical protein
MKPGSQSVKLIVIAKRISRSYPRETLFVLDSKRLQTEGSTKIEFRHPRAKTLHLWKRTLSVFDSRPSTSSANPFPPAGTLRGPVDEKMKPDDAAIDRTDSNVLHRL